MVITQTNASCQIMNTPQSAEKPRLFAHRGSALMAPENTVAAFDFALKHKSDVLETDVRLSRDGTVMVTHDETLERTTNGLGLVRDLDLSDLKNLDAGCKFNDENGNPHDGDQLKLLTLDELFEHYPDVGINIDIKDNDVQAATAVAKVVTRYANSRWTNVGSFNASVIQHFRRCAPNISTAATRQEVARLVFGRAPKKALPFQILQIPVAYWGIQLNRKPLIKKVQAAGAQIVYWTINDTNQMQQLLDKGANGVVTDRADLAQSAFNR